MHWLVRFHHAFLARITQLTDWMSRESPPGPTVWESISDILNNADIAYVFTHYKCALSRRYGGIVKMPLLNQYLISSSTAFERILKNNQPNYEKADIVYDRMKLVFNDGILVSTGDLWRQHRKIMAPAFSLKHMNAYTQTIVAEVQRWLDAKQHGSEHASDIDKQMTNLTLSISFKLFGDISLKPELQGELERMIGEGNRTLVSAIVLGGKFKKKLAHLQTLFRDILYKHERGSSDNNVLALLLAAEQGGELTQEQVINEFKTLIITGHETLSAGLAWAWYKLALNPHYLNWLREELQLVVSGNVLNYKDIDKLVRTKAVLQETFRLYPPVWSQGRTSQKEDVIDGFITQAKYDFNLHIYALHRNPQYWPEPDEFRPERFIEDDIVKNSYLPFGIGPRACIAQQLAMLEGIITLAMIAHRIDIKMHNPRYKEKMNVWISLKPKGLNMYSEALLPMPTVKP